MRRSKTVKRLMALGISRNEAAGFVATYNKLTAQGKSEFLRDIVLEMRLRPTIREKERNIIRFATRQVVLDDDSSFCRLPPEVREGVVRKKMTEELLKGLVRTEAVTIEKWRYDTYGGCTEYIASIRVVEP